MAGGASLRSVPADRGDGAEGDRRVPVTDTNLVRFRAAVAGALAHLESRREEVNDLNVFPVADGDTGDNMALTLSAVLAELDRLQGSDETAHDRRDRARGDRALGRARRAAGGARQLGRDPLPADPRRRRGARQPARAADRRDADRRCAGERGRPRVLLGARAGRGDDPDGRARDGPQDRHRRRPQRGESAPGAGDGADRSRTGRSPTRSSGPSMRARTRSSAAPSCSPRCATPAWSTPGVTA